MVVFEVSVIHKEKFASRGTSPAWLSCVTAGALKLPVPPADALKTHSMQIFS